MDWHYPSRTTKARVVEAPPSERTTTMTANDETPTTESKPRANRPSRPDHEERRDRTDETAATIPVERREYLRSIGVAGALGSLAGLSGATGSVAAQDGDWEAAAEQRIEEHRTSDLEVVVEDENGDPISGAEVQIEMQEHDFGFGTAVHAEFLTNQTEWGNSIHTTEDQQQYQQTIEELFNELVLENLHKWHLWETNTNHADNAVQWARDRGMDVRGHVCIWGNLDAYALPPRVVEAMGDPWASEWDEAGEPNRDIQMVRDEASNHIDEIINHYGDDIKEWEVVNEVLHVPSIIEAIEGQGVTPETAEILGDWYLQAQETASQYDCGVAINDYNIMAENNYSEPDRYEDQMDYLVNERGVDLSGIGMQCHFSLDERKSPDEILQMLDRYAEYGDLNTTEFDMFVDGWDEQQEADFLYQYLKTFFSHPASKDFLVWGHWTPLHWGDDYGDDSSPQNAPFYREDWSEKPALDRYRDLVFDQWWTDESGPTDSSGSYTTNAFLGEHEITVTTDQESTTETVSVTDADGTTTVEVVATGDGDPNGDEPPAIDGTVPQDTTGDGLSNDFTGSGSTTTTDVNVFFENVDNPDVADYPEYYDFDGNGQVTVTDVVDLFESI